VEGGDGDDPARETAEARMQVSKDVSPQRGLLKRIAPDFTTCRWHTITTIFVNWSRLDRWREEAVEATGYERWMKTIDVTVLSAPSV